MKSISDFLLGLNELDVKIWAEGERLRYAASKKVLTPELLAEMRNRKIEILAFLHNGEHGGYFSETDSAEVAVNKVDSLTYNELAREYLNPLRPVVIKNLIQDWPALSKWTPEFFKQNFGSREVIIEDKNYRFKDFIDLVLNSTEETPAPYLRDTSIPETFPELIPDIQIKSLPFSKFNRLSSPFLYLPGVPTIRQRSAFLELLIAGKGTRFPVLHFDYWHLHAFIMQIHGDKEFILYPPDQTKYLYPEFQSSNLSLVDNIEQPDLNRFPLFVNAKPLKIVVKSGESIFVPSGWWHSTRMLTTSFAVTFNGLTGSNWKSFSEDIARDYLIKGVALDEDSQNTLPTVESAVFSYLDGLGCLLSSLEPLV